MLVSWDTRETLGEKSCVGRGPLFVARGHKVSQGSVATCELLVKTSAEQTNQSMHDFGCVAGLFVNFY